MTTNKLKLNPEKNEFIVFGSHIQHGNLDALCPVNILGNFLKLSHAVRILGVIFDEDFFPFLPKSAKVVLLRCKISDRSGGNSPRNVPF